MKVGQVKSQFVAVASIAAELSAVMGVAKEISLAAANAKAIAFRAGEKAKGLNSYENNKIFDLVWDVFFK